MPEEKEIQKGNVQEGEVKSQKEEAAERMSGKPAGQTVKQGPKEAGKKPGRKPAQKKLAPQRTAKPQPAQKLKTQNPEEQIIDKAVDQVVEAPRTQIPTVQLVKEPNNFVQVETPEAHETDEHKVAEIYLDVKVHVEIDPDRLNEGLGEESLIEEIVNDIEYMFAYPDRGARVLFSEIESFDINRVIDADAFDLEQEKELQAMREEEESAQEPKR